eukprot:ANDGO_02471.mRNA.1 2-phosphoglycerate kinase
MNSTIPESAVSSPRSLSSVSSGSVYTTAQVRVRSFRSANGSGSVMQTSRPRKATDENGFGFIDDGNNNNILNISGLVLSGKSSGELPHEEDRVHECEGADDGEHGRGSNGETDLAVAVSYHHPHRRRRLQSDQLPDEDEDDGLVALHASGAASGPSSRIKKSKRGRTGSSKYDFIKTRVWIDTHYYVLSRFLLSRILTTIRIPETSAVGIALDVKKALIDAGKLDISQTEFEHDHLFELMRSSGYGDSHIQLFKVLTKFYHTRTPLLILISGSRGSGKSTLATQLAERMNAPYVLQTDILFELLTGKMHDDPDLYRATESTSTSTSTVSLSSTSAAPSSRLPFVKNVDMNKWQEDADIVFRGIQPEIHKCTKDGKMVIMEGLHLQAAKVENAARAIQANRSSSKGVIAVPFMLVRGNARHRVSDVLQDYLLTTQERDCTILRIDEIGFSGALDAMHERVLSCIQQAVEQMEQSS